MPASKLAYLMDYHSQQQILIENRISYYYFIAGGVAKILESIPLLFVILIIIDYVPKSTQLVPLYQGVH